MNTNERITQKARYLSDEYLKILSDFFPGTIDIEEFISAFNSIFTNYQDSNKRKMDPESIRNRQVSCSSAAALLGLWWLIKSGREPQFQIENSRARMMSKASAHVLIGLPNPDEIELFHYTKETGLKLIPGGQNLDILAPYIINNTLLFLSNRVKILGLPKGTVPLDY